MIPPVLSIASGAGRSAPGAGARACRRLPGIRRTRTLRESSTAGDGRRHSRAPGAAVHLDQGRPGRLHRRAAARVRGLGVRLTGGRLPGAFHHQDPGLDRADCERIGREPGAKAALGALAPFPKLASWLTSSPSWAGPGGNAHGTGAAGHARTEPLTVPAGPTHADSVEVLHSADASRSERPPASIPGPNHPSREIVKASLLFRERA